MSAETEATLKGFEEWVRRNQRLMDKLDRAHIDMDFSHREAFYRDLKDAALILQGKGREVADLMEGVIDDDIINRFLGVLAYLQETAERPSMSKKEREERLQNIKNIYVSAKPMLLSRYKE